MIDMQNPGFREELRLATSKLLAAASLIDAREWKEARKTIEDACSHCTVLLTELDAQIRQSAATNSS